MGLRSAATFAFGLSFGAYFAPSLVGDQGSLGIANIAEVSLNTSGVATWATAIGGLMIAGGYARAGAAPGDDRHVSEIVAIDGGA